MNAREFGKVALLHGGTSAEREISLRSGAAVLQAMQQRGIDVVAVDAGTDVLQQLEQGDFDRAFIILHGRGGEDGVIQGALQTLGLPYTGSGVLGSALGMDKVRSKQIWQSMGLPTPAYQVVRSEADCDAVIAELGLPLFVKPSEEGSSIGIARADDRASLVAAWQAAAACDSPVLVERCINGPEYTASILQGEALPIIKLETPNTFYDFEAKYQADNTRYLCPCGLPEDKEQAYRNMALQAFAAVGASGWGRVDFMLDEQGEPWLLEVNTVPGMTDHSLVPMAAREQGIAFDELVWRILLTSMEVRD